MKACKTKSAILAFVLTCGIATMTSAQESETPGTPDINAGRAAFNISCRSCDSLRAGEVMTGPSLSGLYGRRAASESNFSYSELLRKLNAVWTEDTLDTYLRNPFNMGLQVNMIIHGIVDVKILADLIGFLKHNAR